MRPVDLNAKVWQLSEGEKQVVEILKTLYRGAEILIMDEPSSALTPLETEKLLSSIEAMAANERDTEEWRYWRGVALQHNNRIAEGEVLQLENAGNPDTTESAYFNVIERKTAALFRATATPWFF